MITTTGLTHERAGTQLGREDGLRQGDLGLLESDLAIWIHPHSP
jgi:hypothetical protein